MLSKRIIEYVPKLFKRNFGLAAPILNKTLDPIQQLFVDKIKEYKDKSKSGKLELTPQMEKEKKAELERISKTFGGTAGADMTAFPKFTFPEPKIEISHTEGKQ